MIASLAKGNLIYTFVELENKEFLCDTCDMLSCDNPVTYFRRPQEIHSVWWHDIPALSIHYTGQCPLSDQPPVVQVDYCHSTAIARSRCSTREHIDHIHCTSLHCYIGAAHIVSLMFWRKLRSVSEVTVECVYRQVYQVDKGASVSWLWNKWSFDVRLLVLGKKDKESQKSPVWIVNSKQSKVTIEETDPQVPATLGITPHQSPPPHSHFRAFTRVEPVTGSQAPYLVTPQTKLRPVTIFPRGYVNNQIRIEVKAKKRTPQWVSIRDLNQAGRMKVYSLHMRIENILSLRNRLPVWICQTLYPYASLL